MDAIDDLYVTIGALRNERHALDSAYIVTVSKLAEKMMKALSKTTSEYLHNLFLNENVSSCHDSIKKMISVVPSSLSYKNEKGMLPIQRIAAAPRPTMNIDLLVNMQPLVPYIPLLASQGIRYNVGGGGDKRGGLLVEYPSASCTSDRINVLQMLVFARKNIAPTYYCGNAAMTCANFDQECLKALKALQEANLFFKQDLQKYNLLFWSCLSTGSRSRFEYLAQLDPNGLKNHRYKGKPILHAVIEKMTPTEVQIFISAALKYFPNDVGLLFQKNEEGDDDKTSFELAVSKFGMETTFSLVKQCIAHGDTNQIPILHRVVEHAPQYLNEFAMRYSSSAFVRDENGRTLNQSELASGHRSFATDSCFFVRMNNEQVQEVDPLTGLCPFMVAALDETSDLSAVFYLLKRNPSLVNASVRRNSKGFEAVQEESWKKRFGSNTNRTNLKRKKMKHEEPLMQGEVKTELI